MDNHTPERIIRRPLPEPIPRRLPGRAGFFEGLWAAFAADASATLAELRQDGWTEEAARECVRGYATWIAGNAADAVELAIFLADLEEAA